MRTLITKTCFLFFTLGLCFINVFGTKRLSGSENLSVTSSTKDTSNLISSSNNNGVLLITDNKISFPASKNIDKINQESIKSSGASNVASSLNDLTYINITSGSKGEKTVYFRSFDQRQYVILFDDIPLYDPYNYKYDLSKVPNTLLSEISILKGVSSVLHGPNSMGGIVQLFPKKSVQSTTIDLNNSIEFYDSSKILNQRHNVSYCTGGKDYDFYFGLGTILNQGYLLSKSYSAERNQDSGVRLNGFKKELNSIVNCNYRGIKNNEFHFFGTLIDGSYGLPPQTDISAIQYWRFTYWRSGLMGLSDTYNFSKAFNLKSIVFYHQVDNILSFYDDSSYSSQVNVSPDSHYYDKAFGYILKPTINFNNVDILKMSLQVRRDIHESWEEVTDYRSKDYLDIYSLGIENKWLFIKNWSLIFGIGYDRMIPQTSTRNPLNSYNPIINIENENDWSILFLGAGMKSRFPTLKEMYSTHVVSEASGVIPNEYLTSEKAKIIDAGILLKQNVIKKIKEAKLSLFYNRLEDLIETTYLSTGERAWINVKEAYSYGFDFNIKMNIIDKMNFYSSFSYLKAYQVSDSSSDKPLPYRPTYKLFAELNYIFPYSTKSAVRVTYVADQYYEANYLMNRKMKDYYLTDLRVSKLISNNWNVFIMSKNIFDVNYETKEGYPEAGRSYIIGSEYTF